MTWANLLAILLGGLAVLPVLYTFRMLTGRMLTGRSERDCADADAIPDVAAVSMTVAEAEAVSSAGRRSEARYALGRSERPSGRAFGGRASAPAHSATFDYTYTIRPHTGAMRQDAPDLGGFTKVPLLLYDRLGNCVMVHRRLSLN